MNYVKYNRSLIMLEEQASEFSAKSVPVKGHLKIETGNNKGALRCVVQNLRYYNKGEYIYKLIFFGTKNERTIHTVIGTLLVNRQGNGETYFRFQPLNIDGKGNQLHDYSAAIVAAVSTVDDKESLHPVLRGTILSDAEPFKYDQKDIAAAALNEDEEQEEGVKLNEDKEKANNNTEKDINGEESKKVDNSQEKKDSNQDLKNLQTKNENIKDNTENKNVHSNNYNNFYNRFVLNACAHTCRVAEFYEDISPFDYDKTGAVWKKIVNVASLPIVSPGAHYFSTQYRHFIFGAKANEKGDVTNYYFGIPGRFLNEEQPDAGESGFTYWQPIKGMKKVSECKNEEQIKERKNSYGYWIIEIDGKTGNILGL
ncbi:DUF7922 domain-containing protein [Anaerovorax odorimutans]|uniref:DUF7922 domain-containing protein n=1 Tax=Anaerovorax odorimutans TaxID=109327 RepID=UPI0004090177|nr:hypothetical protein [Anaerovorax odorimutans]